MVDRNLILGLRQGGATPDLTAQQLGVSVETVNLETRRALGLADDASEVLVLQHLELRRIDVLLMTLYQQASKGNQGAVDRVMALQERRNALANEISSPTPDTSPSSKDGGAFPASEATPGQAVSRSSLRDLQALAQADPKACPWWEEYQRLRAEKWTWRKAVFIAWSAMPTDKRIPTTQHELAVKYLGLRSDRILRHWRAKDPAIQKRIEAFTLSVLGQALPDVIQAWVSVAKQPEPEAHRDRITYLETMNVYKPKAPTGGDGSVPAGQNFDTFTDSELDRIIENLREAAG